MDENLACQVHIDNQILIALRLNQLKPGEDSEMRQLIIILTAIVAIVLFAVQVEAKNKPRDKPKIRISEQAITFLVNKEGRQKIAREARELIDLKFEVMGSETTAILTLKDKKGGKSLHTFRSSKYYIIAILYPETMAMLKEDDTFVGFFAEKFSISTEKVTLFILFSHEDADAFHEESFEIIGIGDKQPLVEKRSSEETLDPSQQ